MQDLLEENADKIEMKPTKTNGKKLYSMIMQILNNAIMEGGLLSLPFQKNY